MQTELHTRFEPVEAALVTCAWHGIGAKAVARLARDGFHTVVNYAGNAAAAETAIARIRDAGSQATAMEADVSDVAAVTSLFDRVSREAGDLTVLVINAGVQKTNTLAEGPVEEFDILVGVTLKGSFNVLREAARRLSSGWRIINLSSGTRIVLQPRYGVYAATKVGVKELTAIAAKEMRGRGVTVNAIAPGPVATELLLAGKTPEQIEHAAKQPPLERLGEPHNRRHLLPRRPGWRLGQRPNASFQRRLRLSEGATKPNLNWISSWLFYPPRNAARRSSLADPVASAPQWPSAWRTTAWRS
ncbi:SDR family NAD(P)-dependent oxidoreductase [Sphingomonas sp. PAMC 26617]|uniref:SDR family NAD(P)-dependent oxidoreductase n=1 Tax=Sphingomonas sp. PAMC 26617 TaxID=1112216 RepID=UPI000287E4B9|nr:SDR family NAD(P)-dependent oxidoreductase [Sphingomonas sp. PAMC 26617]